MCALVPGRGDVGVSRISEIAPILRHVIPQLTLIPVRACESKGWLGDVVAMRHTMLRAF